MSMKHHTSSPGEAILPHPQIIMTLNFHRDEFDNITVAAAGFRPGEHVTMNRKDIEDGSVNPIPGFWSDTADDEGMFSVIDTPLIVKGGSHHLYWAVGDQSGATEKADWQN